MERITEEEYKQMPEELYGRKSHFTDILLGMKQNERIFISFEEWKKYGYASIPKKLINSYSYMNRSRLQGKFDWTVEKKKNGWVVTRLQITP